MGECRLRCSSIAMGLSWIAGPTTMAVFQRHHLHINKIFQFWLIVKITKISTQQASTGLTWIAVLDFNGAKKKNVSPATVAAGPTHLYAEKNRKNIFKLYAMITIQRCHKRYLHPGNWMPLGKLKSWQCNNAKKLPFPYFTLFIWNPATNRTKI